MFNYTILDMIELGAEGFKPMSEFHNMKVLAGLKPCLLFNGPAWELNEDLKRLKSLFTDFFYREKVKICLSQYTIFDIILFFVQNLQIRNVFILHKVVTLLST